MTPVLKRRVAAVMAEEITRFLVGWASGPSAAYSAAYIARRHIEQTPLRKFGARPASKGWRRHLRRVKAATRGASAS